MAQLEDKDMEVLGYYAHQGMRERYWNYINYVEKRELGQGYSGYGILALGVVRNDNMPGKIANNYAQNYVESRAVHSLKRQGANDELVSMYTVNQTRAYAEAA